MYSNGKVLHFMDYKTHNWIIENELELTLKSMIIMLSSRNCHRLYSLCFFTTCQLMFLGINIEKYAQYSETFEIFCQYSVQSSVYA